MKTTGEEKVRHVRRIPSLDGLRAISILVVTASHFLVVYPKNPFLEYINHAGGHGVDVFFVISGFLITTLLLKESTKSGTISLKGFYLRRVRRIFPAFAFFIVVVVSLRSVGALSFGTRTLLSAVTYTYNLVPHPNLRVFGPVWSLCVEEHFYLLWPLVVLLVPTRRLPLILASVTAIAVPIRFYLETKHSPINPDFLTLTRWDTIAAGCLLAVLWHGERGTGLRRWLASPRVPFITLGCYFLSAACLNHIGKYELILQHPVESLLLMVLVGSMMVQYESFLGRILNSAVLVWIGQLSYSIYLGQFVLIDLPLPGLCLRLALLTLYATTSYYLIEQPVLKSRRVSAALNQYAPSYFG
jgi:peptidoglycan/LPS O-acetylase OafA/YrhL